MREVLIVVSLGLAGCSSLVCGPGTARVGDTCVAITSDAGADDAGGAADAAAPDAGLEDSGPPDAETGQLCPAVASPASDPGVVSCLAAHCSGTDTCYIDPSTGTGACLPPGAMQLGWAGALLRTCDEAADCDAGSVCCETFHYSGTWHGTTTTCESSCTYGPPAQACRTDAECGAGNTCSGYQLDATLTVSTCHAPIGCR